MTTTVTFAGNLAGDPQLEHTRDAMPIATVRVMVNRGTTNEAGESAAGEPTAHNVRAFGTAAAHAHDSVGRGARVLVHGLVKTDARLEKESGEQRTRTVVGVNDRFGEIGASLRWNAARIERTPALAGTR
jgi:single-strand DNA-binding protein